MSIVALLSHAFDGGPERLSPPCEARTPRFSGRFSLLFSAGSCRVALFFILPPPSVRLSPALIFFFFAACLADAYRTASLEPLAPLAVVPPPSSLLLADGMTVTFPAYLAIFLGTLIPCAFLIILYIQAESRKAGENSMRE